MAHRHCGVPVAKPRPSYSGPTRAAALSGGAFAGLVVILIVLGLVLYGVSKIVTDAANNTAASAPQKRPTKQAAGQRDVVRYP